MSAGAGGSGTIYKWKRYELNSTTRYTWNKWNLNSTTTYKWNKYDTTSSSTPEVYLNTSKAGSFNKNGWDNSGNPEIYENGYNGLWPQYGTSSWGEYPRLRLNYAGYYTRLTVGTTYSFDISKKVVLYEGGGGADGTYYYGSFYCPSSITKTKNSIDLYGEYNWSGYVYGQWMCRLVISKGDFIEEVTSTNSSAYPSNGASGSYWYESAGSSTSYSRGSYIGTVSSSSSSAYPNGSWSGSYWYDGRSGGTTYSQGSAAGTVYNTNRNAYPDNSYTGSYWYVFDGEA